MTTKESKERQSRDSADLDKDISDGLDAILELYKQGLPDAQQTLLKKSRVQDVLTRQLLDPAG